MRITCFCNKKSTRYHEISTCFEHCVHYSRQQCIVSRSHVCRSYQDTHNVFHMLHCYNDLTPTKQQSDGKIDFLLCWSCICDSTIGWSISFTGIWSFVTQYCARSINMPVSIYLQMKGKSEFPPSVEVCGDVLSHLSLYPSVSQMIIDIHSGSVINSNSK